MLAVDGVHKTFPRTTGLLRHLIRSASPTDVAVLHGIDLQVHPGEVVGLVGPNGAGKTTLIRIISTLLEPTAGRVLVAGHDVTTEPLAARSSLGLVLTDDRSLYWRLTGRENLEFFGVMQGLTGAASRDRAAELLDDVGLAGRDKLVFGYSTGMRARLSIARAMLCSPPVLVLDEPTRALDPVATAAIGRLLRSTAADGVGILLSSHRLDEIEAICDRIVVLVEGTVRFDGTPDELAGEARFAEAMHELLTADTTNEIGDEW